MIRMSDDNHVEEKQAITGRPAKGRVKDSQIEGTRQPLEPLEAMAFAQEYISQLNQES